MTLQTRDPRPVHPATPPERPNGDRRQPNSGGARTPRLRPADPDRADRLGTMPAGTVLLVIVGALAVAAVLNAGPMLERAQASELGTGRDVRLGFWEPVEAFSSALGLDRPRALLDALGEEDGPGSGSDGFEIVAGGAPRGRLGHEPLDPIPTAPAVAAVEPTPGSPATVGGAPADGEATVGSRATATPLGLPPVVSPADGDVAGSTAAGPTEASVDDGSVDEASVDAASVDAASADQASVPAPEIAAVDPSPEANGENPPSLAPEPESVAPSSPPAVTEPTDGAATRVTHPNRAVAALAFINGSPFALRRPTADDPLRVLLVGDSTMDAVGTATLRELSATGVTDARLDYRVSTGLSRPDFFDWPAHLREVRAAEQPEVLVIMLGANDAQPILVDGDVEQHGSERWTSAYRQRVAALLDELTAGATWVIWIGQPVMRNEPYDGRLRGLNDIYASETARYPNAVYVDPRPLTSGPDGDYTAYLPDADGNQQLIRQTDGVHLTPDGGERVAPAVLDEIDRVAPLR